MYGQITGNWPPLQPTSPAWSRTSSRPRRTSQRTLLQRCNPGDLRRRVRPAQPIPVAARLEFAGGTDPIAGRAAINVRHPEHLRHALVARRRQLVRLWPPRRRHVQPSYINTFQRGPQESVWETVPQPSWEDFRGARQPTGGYLPLFITDPRQRGSGVTPTLPTPTPGHSGDVLGEECGPTRGRQRDGRRAGDQGGADG